MTIATIILNAIITIVVTAVVVCDVPFIARTKSRIASHGIDLSVVLAVAIHAAITFAAVNIGANLLGQLYGFVAFPAAIIAVWMYGRVDDTYRVDVRAR